MNRKQMAASTLGAILSTTADIITTNTTTTTTNTATTPTTSALLNESRQLLLKQQLKLKLNINVSEMMDNIRRNVDEKPQSLNIKSGNNGHQGEHDLRRDRDRDNVEEKDKFCLEDHKMFGLRRGLNKLDTVTTVPQLQQKFNKFNIIDEAAITTYTTTTTTTTEALTKTCVAAAKSSATTTTSSSSSSFLVNKSLTLQQQQQQSTALAKFNRIIDNTVPVINTYNYQQHVAETLAQSSQQHPHFQHEQQQQQQFVEMPILSDSLKSRLANKQNQYYSTDLVVNNSKINFSSKATTTTTTAAAATISKQAAAAAASASTSKAAATAALAILAAASSSSQQEQETETTIKMSLDEDGQSERNDVHYLLKQLNSFSDIEEIEIVDMKQKQRQLHERQQQQQQKQELLQQQQPFNKEKNYIMAYNNQQQSCVAETSEQQHEESETCLNFTEYQHVESVKQQYVDYVVDTTKPLPQHASTDQLCVLETQMQASDQTPIVSKSSECHVDDSQQQVVVGMQAYTTESKQHYQTTTARSPTATSLVLYSPSSQSHKGIRRYASQEEHAAAAVVVTSASYHPYHHQHYHHHHRPFHHYVHLPHEHCSEGSMLNSAAAEAAAANPLILQQFVDDYIFQSCHYLETNNFVANYRTAMVESSSHEFRPSTTTTTRTSNEEFYEEEEADYIEDHSSAHSFELHETEPPTVICKAPAPLNGSKRSITSTLQQQQPLYNMETRLCSSGVQTDLTASSLAQSLSLSSSLSSSEKRKRKQPLFKCCYTPLDRWREKRSLQQRTKSATTAGAASAVGDVTTTTIKNTTNTAQQLQQLQQITTKNTSVAVVGGPSNTTGCSITIQNSTIATTAAAATTTTTSTTTSTLVVQPQTHQQHYQLQHHRHQHHHQQHPNQSLTKNNNKNNAPYAV